MRLYLLVYTWDVSAEPGIPFVPRCEYKVPHRDVGQGPFGGGGGGGDAGPSLLRGSSLQLDRVKLGAESEGVEVVYA